MNIDFATLLQRIRALPRGQIFRYGAAGDLPPTGVEILALAEASKGRKVIAYTHRRDVNDVLKEARASGFHVNLSADSLEEADELVKTGLPVVVVLPTSYHRRVGETLRQFRDRLGGRLSFRTAGGTHVAICPATYLETDCSRCQACVKPRVGGTVIGFPAHGSRKDLIDERVNSARQKPWLSVQKKRSSSMSSLESARI